MIVDNDLNYWLDVNSLEEAKAKILTGGVWEEQTRKDVQRILDILKVNSSDVVMDFGCGIGRLAKPMSKNCKTILCVDVSDATLRYASKELVGIENVIIVPMLSDIEIPINNEIVNKIYSIIVLQHVERHKVYALLQQFNKCMKVGGEVLIQFPNLSNLEDYRHYLMNKCGVSVTTPLMCFYTKEELKLFFEDNGFEILNYNEDSKDFYIHAKKIKPSNWWMANGIIPHWRTPE